MGETIIKKSGHKTLYLVDDKLIKTYDGTYSTSQVLNEALNQAKVVEAGINAPKVYEVKYFHDRLGIVMQYIEGMDLLSLTNDRSSFDKYLTTFVETQHTLFSSKMQNLNNSYGRIKNKIFATNLPANIQYGLFYKLRSMEFAHDVIHGDYTLSNVLIDKNGEAHILDWSHVAYGDKKLDIAISYAIFNIDGEKEIADKYLDRVCSFENIQKESVLDYMLLAYAYIVDRYDENARNTIYDKMYEIIKDKEA